METLYNVLPHQNQIRDIERWAIISMYYYPQVLNYYTISTYGRVFNNYDNKYIAPRVTESKNKYLNVSLRLRDGGMRTFDVHRLMLMTFNPVENYQNLVCNHIDGIKCHNWIWNLEWTDTRGNTIHAINNGLISMGSNRANGIATEDFIRKICEEIQVGYSTQEIVSHFNPPPVECNVDKLVNNIKNGHCHSNISKDYDFSKAYNVNDDNRRFTEDQINRICELFQKYGKELPTDKLCYMLGIDFYSLDKRMKNRYYAAVNSIREKKTFKEICNKYNY